MTTTDEKVDKLVEDLKKDGFNIIAYGTAKDLFKLMEEGKFSKKTLEAGK